jgi:hypothetical protein
MFVKLDQVFVKPAWMFVKLDQVRAKPAWLATNPA